MENTKVLRRLDDLIKARNEAQQAYQAFADAHVMREPDKVSDALYEATYELVHRLDNLIDSIEWKNILLGIEEN